MSKDKETILQELEELPDALLDEVIDFIRFLKGEALPKRSLRLPY